MAWPRALGLLTDPSRSALDPGSMRKERVSRTAVVFLELLFGSFPLPGRETRLLDIRPFKPFTSTSAFHRILLVLCSPRWGFFMMDVPFALAAGDR